MHPSFATSSTFFLSALTQSFSLKFTQHSGICSRESMNYLLTGLTFISLPPSIPPTLRYVTLPSLAYSALLRMLQKSNQDVELVSDEDHYRFVQRSKRVF